MATLQRIDRLLVRLIRLLLGAERFTLPLYTVEVLRVAANATQTPACHLEVSLDVGVRVSYLPLSCCQQGYDLIVR